jgi:hypothetical protein
MNEVAIRANDVLRNDVMLRIIDKRTEISYNVYEINQSLCFYVREVWLKKLNIAEELMDFLNTPITSDRLEAKGQALYLRGKRFMFIGACGFALLVLISIVAVLLEGVDGVAYLFTFDVDEDYMFAILLMLASYIGIILGFIGIPMYFSGLNIFALGRIAHNTEKE